MAENAKRKQGGRPFRKGQSGNPKGKAPGTRHRATQMAEQLMEADGAAIVQAVLAAAKGGDMTAARIVLDRIAPVRKGRPVVLKGVPVVKTASDIAGAMAALTASMAAGEVTPDEAQTIASVFEMRRRALETEELERRLLALEMGQKP